MFLHIYPIIILLIGPAVIEFSRARKLIPYGSQKLLGVSWRSGFGTSVQVCTIWYVITRLSGDGLLTRLTLIAALIPRDVWTRVPIGIPTVRQIGNVAKYVFALTLFMLLLGSLLGGFAILLQWVLGRNLFIVFGPFITAIGLVNLLYSPAKMAIVEAIARFKDYRFLAGLKFPDAVNRSWVFGICQKFHSAGGRRRFLELLLIRAVQVSDAPQQPPRELLEDQTVRELLARLEERWIGLER